MKTLILIFGLSLFYLLPKAQEKVQTMSAVEQFCTTPGRTIVGNLIYKETIGWDAITVRAMRYTDMVTKESIPGITFSAAVSYGGGDHGVYKTFEAMVDTGELTRVISWMENNRWILNSADSTIGYLSYTPNAGNYILKLHRRLPRKASTYPSKNWDFIIQFNRYDISSAQTFSTDLLSIMDRLKELRRMMGN